MNGTTEEEGEEKSEGDGSVGLFGPEEYWADNDNNDCFTGEVNESDTEEENNNNQLGTNAPQNMEDTSETTLLKEGDGAPIGSTVLPKPPRTTG